MIIDDDYSVSTERVSDEYLTLNSCGIQRLGVIDRGSRRVNGRLDYHILYIEQGCCHLTLDGQEVCVGAGGVILFRPREPQIYSFRAADDSVSHYIHFTGSGCAELLGRLNISDLRVFDMGNSRSYEEISAKMAREYTMKRPMWESWCAAYLYELLNIIARKYILRHNNVSRIGETRINAACRRIYDNLAEPPDISELAVECCLSESRFCHLFREVTGKSVKAFVLSMKTDRAMELLRETDMSVREIAEAVGYVDQNYFSRMFRREVGVSPSEYRRREG